MRVADADGPREPTSDGARGPCSADLIHRDHLLVATLPPQEH
jgi:hypothetical protein